MIKNDVILQINQLSKKTNKSTLIEPLNYNVSRGQILAICGGNGAGKSTLIKLIIGLIKATSGDVIVSGLKKSDNKRKYLEQFGYMPDDFIFPGSMTTRELIEFYARIKNVNKQKYEDILDEVGLLDKLNEKVGNFSKGMKQRLLLAQTLLSDPNILILDEPTNGLDPYWINQLCHIMLTAKKNDQTVIFSTHDLHVVEKIADEVLFLGSGQVIGSGPIQHYLDEGLYETFQKLYFDELYSK